MRQVSLRASIVLLGASLLAHLTEGNEVNHGERLIQWLHEEGGYVNDKIEIRREDPSDATARFGVFTNSALKEKEIILTIPNNCLLTAANGNEEEEDEEDGVDSALNCQLVRSLIAEMKQGDDSKYAPYVDYLMSEPWGQLPSGWSDEGRALLVDMLESYTVDPIPPLEPENWLEDWHVDCNGNNDIFEANASLLVVQRSWDSILIPVYDMMSHRNGRWLNTESNGVHGDSDLIIRAKRSIKAGEELHASVNMCEDCGSRKENYGTPEILRDYGFIEPYPQRWIFPDAVAFQIDEEKEGSGILSLSWIGPPPTLKDVDGLKDIQEGMKAFAKTQLKSPSRFIPINEITTIRQFHKALTQAIDLAHKIAYTDDEACNADDVVCVVPSTRYDNLSEDTYFEYDTKLCDIEAMMDFKDYNTVEEINTSYQQINVMHNPKNNDTCFDLNDTIQICTSYRPHYHEMSIHYAARYLERIKRVLFVGGGDSMLLHEILKYPSIEVVVGLQTDQRVTRMSFKYFGAQPHWDNDKVEWWFGDAAKSFWMLPKDYFGSFDMVLVDLSETAFELSDGLDSMRALSLLLTPDGIMLKNEIYFEAMKEIFAHTVQYVYDDVPRICSQTMVIGSNSIDFLRQEDLIDHGVDNLFIGPLDYEKHFTLYHDYAWNPDNINYTQCMRENDILNQVPTVQLKSPGIVMIVEAEDASATQNSSKEMAGFIANTLNNEGFSVISTIIPGSENKDYTCVVVMSEGYVVSHFWPDFMYYGFDIHLWGRFEKQENIKKALLLAVGSSSQSSSSFRIVAGGMFGTNSWRTDYERHGPHHPHACDHSKLTIPDINTNVNLIETIFEQSMGFIEQGAAVLVVCGLKNLRPCPALEILQESGRIGEAIDVWTCPNINEFQKNSAFQVYACEQDLFEMLRNRLVQEKKLDAIFLDQSATYSMGQILIRIFKNLKSRVEFLSASPTIVAISDNDTKAWQTGLVNKFRTEVIIYNPVFTADILVEGASTNIGVHIVLTNKRSISLLREVLTSIEEKAGARAVVKEVLGGVPAFDPNFSPSQEFKPDDYDQIISLKQMNSQHPLEYQTIFQLEVTANTAKGQRGKTKLLKNEIRFAVEQALSSVHSGHTPSSLAHIQEFPDLGDGCLLIAILPGGRAVVVWDGRNHIDINLRANNGDKEYFDRFEEIFLGQLPSMKTIIRDEHPRGYGRVIDFPEDIKPISELL